MALAIPPEAKYVGEKACIKCHDVEAKHFGHTLHAKVFRQNPGTSSKRRVCEACHGPGSLHVPRDDHKKRDYLIGFTREWGTPVEEQNAVCLNCHKGGQRLHWAGSIHDTNKLACSDCHNAMARFSADGPAAQRRASPRPARAATRSSAPSSASARTCRCPRAR